MNQELVSALKDIISDKGIDFLSDNTKLTVCMLSDLVPTADKERRRIKIALESQAFEELLKISGDPNNAEKLFQKAVVFLVDETDWSEDIADDTLSMLFAAVFPNIRISSNTDTAAAVSQPAKKNVVKVSGQGYEYFDDDYTRKWSLEFTKKSNGYAISRYTSFMDDKCMELPSIYNGRPVVEIGDSVFESCSFESVGIPNSIVRIGDNAFRYCDSLKTIQLPDSICSIGRTAFADTKIRRMLFPKSLESVYCDSFAAFDELAFLGRETSFEITKRMADVISSYSGHVLCQKEVCITDELNKKMTIYCLPGSSAFSFAKQYGITCRHISEYNV